MKEDIEEELRMSKGSTRKAEQIEIIASMERELEQLNSDIESCRLSVEVSDKLFFSQCLIYLTSLLLSETCRNETPRPM